MQDWGCTLCNIFLGASQPRFLQNWLLRECNYGHWLREEVLPGCCGSGRSVFQCFSAGLHISEVCSAKQKSGTEKGCISTTLWWSVWQTAVLMRTNLPDLNGQVIAHKLLEAVPYVPPLLPSHSLYPLKIPLLNLLINFYQASYKR